MNKKQSSKMQLGKYVFIIPAVVLGSLILSISEANNEAQIVDIQEVHFPVFSDTLPGIQDETYRIVDAERHIADPERQTPLSSYTVTEAKIMTISPDTKSDKGKKANHSPVHQDTVKNKDPLFIVDGVKQLSLTIQQDQIESVNVIKNKTAISLYGEEGRHGVVEVTTKQGRKETNTKETSVSVTPNPVEGAGGITKTPNSTTLETGNLNDNVLLFVDGAKTPYGALKQLDPTDIESITVLKGENAMERYGNEGKEGVIVIITKGKN